MKAYKGFNRDMTCRGFHYAEGQSYETDNAECCESGFHACEHPLDCFGYYAPAEAVFHEVELDGKIDTSSVDTKVAATKIKIGARLTIPGLVKAAFDFVRSRCTNENNAEPGKAASAGDYGAASAGYKGAASAGDYGAASAGDYGAASAGYKGAASAGPCGAASAGDKGTASAGYYGAASAGPCGAASAGYKGAASAGDKGAASAGPCGAASAGDKGAASAGDKGTASAGYYGAASAGDKGAASAGYYGAAVSRGSASVKGNGVACARGNGVKVKGGFGAILVLVEEHAHNYDVAAWKAVRIDGRKYKADTWYALEDGKIVEAQEGGAE